MAQATIVEPLTAMYTPFSKTTVWPDGRFQSELSSAPRFSQSGGVWHTVQQTLTAAADGTATGETVLGPVSFGRSASDLVKLSVPGGTLTITAPDLSIQAPSTSGSIVTYADVARDTDLRYTVSPAGVKEDIVLRSAAAPTSFRFRVADPEGVLLAPRELADGGLLLRDDGDWRVVVPPPLVTDATGRPALHEPVDYTWRADEAGLDLTVTLDPTWWVQPHRFPVTIDPSVYFLQSAKQVESRTGIFNGAPGTTFANGALYPPSSFTLGSYGPTSYAVNGGRLYWRNFLRFSMADLPPGSRVDNAQLELSVTGRNFSDSRSVAAYRATSDRWLEEGVLPGEVIDHYDPAAVSSSVIPSAGQQQFFSLTATVQDWVRNPSGNDGVMLAFQNELAPSINGDYFVSADYVGSYAKSSQAAQMPLLRVDGMVSAESLTTANLLAANNITSPLEPCADTAGGCPMTNLDYTDPTFQHRNFSGITNAGPVEGATCSSTTDCFSRQQGRQLGTVLNFTKVLDGNGGQFYGNATVGVNPLLGHPGRVAVYDGCRNERDPYAGSCMYGGRGGYWYSKAHFPDGRNNFSGGIFIDNKPTSDAYRRTCPNPCSHYWGQRMQGLHMEVWPRRADNGAVRDFTRANVRWASQFNEGPNNLRNRREYWDGIGAIRTARLVDPAVSRLKGRIYRSGLPVGKDQVLVRIFEYGASSYWKSTPTASSPGGHLLQSFSTPNSTDSGTYDSGAMYAGEQTVKVIDKATEKVRCYRILVDDVNDVAYFDVGKDNFGRDAGYLPRCPF